MNLTYTDELEALMALVEYKQYQRYGQTLYAKYETLKPECTIGELVWGWCHNPCFAVRLIAELESKIPNCERFTALMSKANRLVEKKFLNISFDQAMRQVCKKGADRTMLAYSTESTNMKDVEVSSADGTGYCLLNATDEDGELWHGLLVSDDPKEWDDNVDSVTITIYRQTEDDKVMLWCNMYSASSVLRHTRSSKDVRMFLPFKHPMILLGLNLTIETRVYFRRAPVEEFPAQVFGVAANNLCNWLSSTTFETKIGKGVRALIDMPKHTISFCQ